LPGVKTTVDLDEEFPLQAREIDNERSDGYLPPKMAVFNLPPPQSGPEALLSRGEASAEVLRES
jgi:hypothetical protein